MVRFFLYILLGLITSCAPHLTWDSPCDPSLPAYSEQKCRNYILQHSEVDFDGDSYSTLDGDCDELSPEVNPGVPEKPDDGIDNNCNNIIDEGKSLWSHPLTFTSDLAGVSAIDVTGESRDEMFYLTHDGGAGIVTCNMEELYSKALQGVFSIPPIATQYSTEATIIAVTDRGKIYSLNGSLQLNWATSEIGTLDYFKPEFSSDGSLLILGANVQTYEGVNGSVYVVRLSSGALSGISLSDALSASPLSYGNLIIAPLFTTHSTGHIAKVSLLDFNGKLLKDITFGGDPLSGASIYFENGGAYLAVSSFSGSVGIIDLKKQEVSGYPTLLPAGVYLPPITHRTLQEILIYVVTLDNTLSALKPLPQAPEILWQVKLEGRVQSQPAICQGESGEFMILADESGNVIALDPYEGKIVWTLPLASGKSAVPLCLKGCNAFAIYTKSSINVFSLGTGK